jgi:hypothetical protein
MPNANLMAIQKEFMNSIIEIKKKAKILSKKQNIKIKEALEHISIENGFTQWKDYRNSLDTFWYKKFTPFLTEWFTTHSDAKKYQSIKGGFLLTYKGQYFVVDENYIEFLGINPKADIWKVINYDVSTSNSYDKIYEYLININFF